jgi:quercetin dioxygenase-like cupin family protein
MMSTLQQERLTTEAVSEETFDVFGIQLQFLVTPQQTNEQVSVYRGTIPPGVFIPLHSHAESEIFYVLDGALEVFRGAGSATGWSSIAPGRVVAIPGDRKHALRNTSTRPTTVVLVTQNELYGFFRELAKSLSLGKPPAPPSPQEMQHLFAAAAKYHYWIGSPAENAEIGLYIG